MTKDSRPDPGPARDEPDDPPASAPDEHAAPPDKPLHCPHCDETIPRQAFQDGVCPACNQALEAVQPPDHHAKQRRPRKQRLAKRQWGLFDAHAGSPSPETSPGGGATGPGSATQANAPDVAAHADAPGRSISNPTTTRGGKAPAPPSNTRRDAPDPVEHLVRRLAEVLVETSRRETPARSDPQFVATLEADIELRRRELELREKELELRENALAQASTTSPFPAAPTATPDGRPPTPGAGGPLPEDVECAHCGETVFLVGAAPEACPFCGEDLPSSVQRAPAAPARGGPGTASGTAPDTASSPPPDAAATRTGARIAPTKGQARRSVTPASPHPEEAEPTKTRPPGETPATTTPSAARAPRPTPSGDTEAAASGPAADADDVAAMQERRRLRDAAHRPDKGPVRTPLHEILVDDRPTPGQGQAGGTEEAAAPMVAAFRLDTLSEDAIERAKVDARFLEPAERPITVIPDLDPESQLQELFIYAIEPPYSYVRMSRHKVTRKLVYEVIEPQLSPAETERLQFIEETLVKTLDVSYDELESREPRDYLRAKVDRIIDDYDIRLAKRSAERIHYYLYRRYIGYGKVHVLMLDPTLEDISCDGPRVPLFVFHRQEGSIATSMVFDSHDELDRFVLMLAQRSGRHISVADPLLDATLPDGSRLQATIGSDVTTRGSTFTVRRFRPEPITPPEIVGFGTISDALLAYLWLAVQYGRSVIIAGGTASGKTTTLNAVSLFIPPSAKIVSIEDTRELSLSHDNWIPGVTRAGTGEMIGQREAGAVSMFDLLRAALRQRPEYIIMGEIRGEEANVLFQAMATGHTVFSTMHADSVRSVVHRLESKPIFIPRNLLNSLDIVVTQAQVRIRGKRVRRVESITEIVGIDPDTEDILTNEVFYWDIPRDRFEFTGTSRILEQVQRTNNWTDDELHEELRSRVAFLGMLRKNDWTSFEAVARSIHAFFDDPELAMRLIGVPRAEAPHDHPLVHTAARKDENEGNEVLAQLLTKAATIRAEVHREEAGPSGDAAPATRAGDPLVEAMRQRIEAQEGDADDPEDPPT